ncbi:hypothetical protein N431DRAFT_428907 [Stipitochalara longipes BDJ]|nr:hypothetical protein N431DRAFT_428907 [Stipitochalara longipes BDJ]
MPNTRKCQACRISKKRCSRDGGDWNEQDAQTRCSRCKSLNRDCGPDEYKDEDEREVILGMGQQAGAADNRGFQPLAPALYTEAYLRKKLRELSNSESYCTTRQNIKTLEQGGLHGFIVPEDLSRTLKDIEELAWRAYASNDRSIAELALITLIEWYDALGLEFQQHREGLLMKVGDIFEKTEWNDHAEKYYLKIFDYLLVAPADANTPFHHAIRNVKKKGPVGKDALMRTIRCCPLVRFRSTNEERQTPLWLAVSTNEEEVIVAMIERLKGPQRQCLIDPIILDARDCHGLTILTTAVMVGCRLPVIDALIQCGCEVNPSTTPGGPLTPLQAASTPGYERPDVAWLLLQHHANLADVCLGSNIAAQLALGPLSKPAYVPLFP